MQIFHHEILVLDVDFMCYCCSSFQITTIFSVNKSLLNILSLQIGFYSMYSLYVVYFYIHHIAPQSQIMMWKLLVVGIYCKRAQGLVKWL